MLNTATDTRIGPSRMYVDLSREWAALGLTAVRVDLSGIGDTPARDGMRENWAFSPSFVRDVQTILDFLVARGVKRVVLMGLCSGAYLAYHTAVADPRVAGTLLVNPQSFHYREGDEFVRTTEFKSMGFYRSALFRGETWKKALRGEVHLAGIARTVAHKLVARGRARLSRLAAKTNAERSPSVDVAEYLEEMCDRGVDVHFVFGDTDPGLDYLRSHLREREESLRARKNFHVSIIDDVDHTFTRSWARRVLFDRLTAHVVERFG